MSSPYFDFSKPKKHSDHSASGSHRWLECAASVSFTRDLPKKDSVWSFGGTVAHELLRCSLETGVCATKIRVNKYTTDRKILDLIDDGMRERVKSCVDYVKKIADEFGGEIIFETKVHLDWIHKGMSGTLDVGVVVPYGDVHVIDFKDGAGVEVESSDNSQMIFYGLGLVGKPDDWDFGNLHTHVFQPRRNNISVSTLTKSELLVWVQKFRDGVARTLVAKPKFNPGDHCRFCEGKSTCTAMRGVVEKSAQMDFAEPSALPVPIKKLSNVQIASILERADLIIDWVNSVKAQAYHRLEQNEKIPGFKLVNARGQRQWSNQKQLERVFKSDEKMWHPPEFKSPAQMEKLMGKKWVDKRVTYKPGKPKLVSENDSREKMVSQIEQEFNDE